ncbi:MAG TPA: hypothetical protein VGK74_03075 [Symbiobacteriaceae bacterium]|jgi:hypothetical protein
MSIWWMSLILTLAGLAGLCLLLGPQPHLQTRASADPPGLQAHPPITFGPLEDPVADQQAKPPA